MDEKIESELTRVLSINKRDATIELDYYMDNPALTNIYHTMCDSHDMR